MGNNSLRCMGFAPAIAEYFRKFLTGIAVCIAMLVGFGGSSAEAQDFRFSAFQINGNFRVDNSTILARGGLAAGQVLSTGELNDAYQAVIATGLFETVTFTPRGATLIITVVEYPTVNRISIEGNRKISDERALALIRTQPRLVFNPDQVERDAAALAAAYKDEGRVSATVTPKIIERNNNRVDVIFEVQEGGIVEVERLTFVGNRVYSDRRLRRVLETKQAGALRLLVSQDTFVEDRIAFDKAILRDFYQARGYVDFVIESVAVELTRERDGFFITFNVREGQQFRFGDISVTSSIPEVDVASFEQLARLRTGRTYTPEAVDNVIERMEKLATEQGLNFLRVDPRVTRNDRDLSLDIEFALVRGPRVFVERIDISGNVTTLDRVIRRQFRFVEGDPFNPREIREAASRIRALGLFANAAINAREGSTTDQVVVDVGIQEQLTGTLSFGAAFNFTTGIGATATFRERNFLGRGQTLNFDLTIGLDNNQGGLTFIEPAFLGRDLQFEFDGEFRQTAFDYTNYDTENLLFRPGFSYPAGEFGRFGLSYTLASDKIFNVSADSSPVLMAEAADGTVLASALGYTYRFDTRNRGLDPNSGILFRIGQDFAGLGGDARYVKTTALVSAETKVRNEEVTLRATLEGGALYSLAGDSRLTDRFFLTSNKMRGFAPAGVGPRDESAINKDALGGNYFAAARFETEFPLGLPEELGIKGGLFLDVGSVWGLDNTNAGLVDDGLHLRSSVGFSVFWDTPIGPLRFNFSTALDKESYDRVQDFDLTISTQF